MGERGFPSIPTATKSICSSHFLYCTPIWELHRCSSSQPLKPRQILPVYSTPKAELPQLKPSFQSRLWATTQLVEKDQMYTAHRTAETEAQGSSFNPSLTTHSSNSVLILSEEHGDCLQKAIALHTTSLFTAQTTPHLSSKKPQQIGRFQLDWQDL